VERRCRVGRALGGAASCTLLDELVVALAALRLHRDQSATEALAATAAVAFAAGSVLGTSLTDQAVARLGRRAVLLGSAVACVIAVAAMTAPHGVLSSCLALFVVAVVCAPHHALSLSRAYDELPDSPGAVQALAQVFVVVDVLGPLALGVVADRFGLGAAIGCLTAQPVVIFACAALD